MNAVLGMSELLADTVLSQEQRFYLDAIRSSGSHLISLIDDILDLTKIETASIKLNHESVSLRKFLDEVVCISKYSKTASLIQYQKNKHVEFQLEVDEDVPENVLGIN